ncbi:hypothetical protein CCACVL1_23585 [Corchorus capsularis]|uniref:Uncharacterized protein n=1 Tax=Corchorus capsularis TaxID=210143 RepID=A0A1R3GTF9_COCAP|nr:hypothetical protein CCACVL1_23585 [Corchorus capsularis]
MSVLNRTSRPPPPRFSKKRLKVSVQKMQENADQRQVEQIEDASVKSQDRSLKAHLSNGDAEERIKSVLLKLMLYDMLLFCRKPMICHIHKREGSFNFKGNPRRTIPKNKAVDPFSGKGAMVDATEITSGLVEDDESASKFIL